MDGDFTDYKPGYYTVEFSQADDFRNKDKTEADLAKWGTAYAVKFKGDAGTYYWSSRTKPEDGQRVYGHVEPSKSGKSMNFRRDEDPNKGQPSLITLTSSAGLPKDNKYLKDVSDVPVRMIQSLLPYYDVQQLVSDGKASPQFTSLIETAQALAEEALRMVDNVRGDVPKPQTPVKSGLEKARETADRIKGVEEGDPDLPEGW